MSDGAFGNFGNRKGRKRRMHRRIKLQSVRRPGADINVTPLVDVVLVLLIIFMVFTPVNEQNVDVQLALEQSTKERAEVSPEQVLVTVHREALRVNDREIARADCVSSLRALLAARAQADRVVFVSATDATSYAELVEVIDAARAAGATEVGLVSERAPSSGGAANGAVNP